MPTGYTAPIYEGTEITFPEFVLRCAHAFVMDLRDHQPGTPIPESKVSDYTIESVERERREVARLRNLSGEQAQAEATRIYEERIASEEESTKSKNELRARYEAMLDQVRAWEPPTERHENLKNYMISQLEESIEFDCALYERDHEEPDGLTWQMNEITWHEQQLIRAKEHLEQEQERVAANNAWKKALIESIQ